MTIRVWAIWYADRNAFVLQWKDPITGRRRSQRCTASSRRAADKAARELEAELNAGGAVEGGRMDWEPFCELYMESHVSGLKRTSESKVASILDVYTQTMAPKCVGDVTTPALALYVSRLRSLGRSESTIRGHLVILRHALKFAHRHRLVAEVPYPPEIVRGASGRKAKGRPLTLPEFVRMLRAVQEVIAAEHVNSWRHFLKGLWLSGLRLDEALHLTWDDPTQLRIVLTGKRPLLALTAEHQKSNRDQLCPLTPDFCRLILRTPELNRSGQVFPLGGHGGTVTCKFHVSRQISEIGKAAGVVVDHRSGKFASAHDLRRTFGTRWAHRVAPATLRELMRHATIQTTMEYYAMSEAENVAELLWSYNIGHNRGENSTASHKTQGDN